MHTILLPTKPRRPAHVHRLTCTVTFEFDLNPPLTYRGPIQASHVGTGARMAVQQAAQALRPARWQSVVVVLDRER